MTGGITPDGQVVMLGQVTVLVNRKIGLVYQKYTPNPGRTGPSRGMPEAPRGAALACYHSAVFRKLGRWTQWKPY